MAASMAAMLRHFVASSKMPCAEVARQCGMKKQALSQVLKGKRRARASEITRIAQATGHAPLVAMLLVMIGRSDLIDDVPGDFVDEYITAFPIALCDALGHRAHLVKKSWAKALATTHARKIADYVRAIEQQLDDPDSIIKQLK